MTMDQGACLRSKPISEVVISQVDQQYISRIIWYLEHLGCKVTYQGRPGEYQIQFPAGTTENVYAGRSTQWTHHTIICLPSGQRLTKYVVVSLPHVEKSITMVAFPNDVLFGPEPQQM